MSLASFNNQQPSLTPQRPAAATLVGEFPPVPKTRSSQRDEYNDRNARHDPSKWQYLYVLPVLLMEFLALALTRAALPSMLINQYGDSVYFVMGLCDAVRGLLAFVACPLFGKLSDIIGRRMCLLVTVLGTCAPVCSLAFFTWESHPEYSWHDQDAAAITTSTSGSNNNNVVPDDATDSGGFWNMIMGDDDPQVDATLHPAALTTFVVLLSLSGIFSSTFTLVFAYISDTVKNQDERVSAYGLALATFGLSFTIGPIAGGYLARSHKQYVFVSSLLLTVLDLIYIYLFLPESRPADAVQSIRSMDTEHLKQFSWNPVNTIRLIAVDPFLRRVSKVAFLYYTGLWALISTLSVYAVKRFHLGPERLGELMSALGLSTMIAEAVLVRIMVPLLGEKQSMKIGLASFAIQCVVLGFAYEPWHLFVVAFFSLLGNLVYPSLSSLVSGSVEPESVGEALGAVNGIKALTEGIGPLVFGSLMTLSETSALPGWPYLLAAALVVAAYQATTQLPDSANEDTHDEYIHELELKASRGLQHTKGAVFGGMLSFQNSSEHEDDSEYEGLLSEIDEGSVFEE